MLPIGQTTLLGGICHRKAQLTAFLALFLLLSAVLLRNDTYISTYRHNVKYSQLTQYVYSPAAGDFGLEDLARYLTSTGDHYALGILEFWQSHYSEAIRRFSLALEKDSSDSISRYFLANALYKLEEPESALDQWAQIGVSTAAERYIVAAKESTIQSDVAYWLALAETAVGRLAADSPEAYVHLAEAYEFHNDLLGAIKSYRQATALEKDRQRLSILFVRLGRALRRNDQQQEALAAFEQAVVLAPLYSNAHVQLADQYAHMGLFEKASARFEHALRLDPNNPYILVTIGNFHSIQDQPRIAEEWYQRAIEADPNLGFGEFGLGRLALAEEKPAEAIRYLEQAIRLGWDSYSSWLDLGCAYRDVGNADAAIEIFRKVVDMDNTPPRAAVVAWQNLAMLYLSRDELHLAQAAWENILKIDPNNQKALDALRELP